MSPSIQVRKEPLNVYVLPEDAQRQAVRGHEHGHPVPLKVTPFAIVPTSCDRFAPQAYKAIMCTLDSASTLHNRSPSRLFAVDITNKHSQPPSAYCRPQSQIMSVFIYRNSLVMLCGLLCSALVLQGVVVDGAVERAIFTSRELHRRVRSSFYAVGVSLTVITDCH